MPSQNVPWGICGQRTVKALRTADIEGLDQTAHPRSLIKAFPVSCRNHWTLRNVWMESKSPDDNLLMRIFLFGFNDTSTLVGHLCHLQKKKKKRKRKLIVEEMKERVRKERGTRMKAKKLKKSKPFPLSLTCYKDSRPCPTASQYQLDAPVT